MIQEPFFSIVLPTYNRSKFIGKAISSALDQVFTDFELIIINDGSTDNTKDVVLAFHDERIVYYYQENQKLSDARNNGIKKSRGQYICFLDDDDYYLATHLTVLYESIRKNDFPVALFHTYQTYMIDGKEKNEVYYDNFKSTKFSEVDCRLINNVWLFSPPAQAMAVHKDIFSSILFITQAIPAEAYDFIGRVSALYDIIKIKERTFVMQIHENNSTAYTVKFLENYLKAFMYLVSNPIYSNIREHFSIKNRFYSIYIGLADCYVRSGRKTIAIKYLTKALINKTNLKNNRIIFGIIKQLIIPYNSKANS